MPVSVKLSISPVTIEALPLPTASNMSASGTRQSLWSQGLYRGVKWVSTS
jgi:hypothetical protein